jgi:hypothetical protein
MNSSLVQMNLEGGRCDKGFKYVNLRRSKVKGKSEIAQCTRRTSTAATADLFSAIPYNDLSAVFGTYVEHQSSFSSTPLTLVSPTNLPSTLLLPF